MNNTVPFVSKSDLKQFNDLLKDKLRFKQFVSDPSENSYDLGIITSIPSSKQDNITFQCIFVTNDQKYANIIYSGNDEIYTAINTGDCKIADINIYSTLENNTVGIEIKIDTTDEELRYIQKGIVDVTYTDPDLESQPSYNYVSEVRVMSDPLDGDVDTEHKRELDITQPIAHPTEVSFSLKTGENTSTEYAKDEIFDTIFNAVQAQKLNHSVGISIDSETLKIIAEDSQGNEIDYVDSTFEDNVLIPIDLKPQDNINIPEGSTTKDFYKVSVNKYGIVTSGDETFPTASDTEIGGVKIFGDSNPSNANYAKVELDSENRAYVNIGSQDIHRYGLAPYQTLPPANAENLNKIVQWIGETGIYRDSEDSDKSYNLYNGYFYKCVILTEISFDQSNSGSLRMELTNARNLYRQNTIRNNLLSFTDGAVLTLTKESQFATAQAADSFFKLSQEGNEFYYIIPYEQLALWGIKIVDGATSTSTDPVTFTLTVSVNPTTYEWEQYNVQPIADWNGSDVRLITNSEIDEMFVQYPVPSIIEIEQDYSDNSDPNGAPLEPTDDTESEEES